MARVRTRRGRPPRRPGKSVKPVSAEDESDSRDQTRNISIGGLGSRAQEIPPTMSAPVSSGWVMDRARIPLLAKSAKDRFTLFHGGSDPWVARAWLDNLADTFEYMTCTDAEKVGLAAYHFRDQAVTWWKMQKMVFGEQDISWSLFRDAFERQYFPASFCIARSEEFLSLKQGHRSVMEYNAEFTKLAEFCPHLVTQDRDRMFWFTQGLAAYIRLKMSGSSISTYREALDRAIFIEMTQQQVAQKKEADKQTVQSESKNQNPPTAGQKRQDRNSGSQDFIRDSSKPQKSSRPSSGSSSGSQQNPGNKINAIKCHRCGSSSHMKSECPLEQPICFYCELPGHMIRDCNLKAQLESTKTSTHGMQPTQQRPQKISQKTKMPRQQRRLPPQTQLYHLQERKHAAIPTVIQYPTAPVTYYSAVSAQQYLPAVPQPYMLSSQQPQQQISGPQSQIQPEWRQTIAHSGTQPPSVEVGRDYAITREEAQQADGSVIQAPVGCHINKEAAMTTMLRELQLSLNQTQRVRLQSALQSIQEVSSLASTVTVVADTIPVNHEDSILKGHGTSDLNGEVVATLCGVVERINKLVYVRAQRARYKPEVGDIIVGRVIEIAPKRWRLEINFSQDAVLMPSSMNLPDGIQRRRTAVDELNMHSIFEENDVICAEVHGFQHDGSLHLQASSQKYGKLERGMLLTVPAYLVKRGKQHLHHLEQYGVDLILGCNGFIWVGEHVTSYGETDSATYQENREGTVNKSGELQVIQEVQEPEETTPLEVRQHMCRVANSVRLLSALGFNLTLEFIIDTVEASITSNTNIKDMLAAEFYVQTAERVAQHRVSLSRKR